MATFTVSQLLKIVQKRKYSKPGWQEHKVKIDVNTPFEQMKKKEIDSIDVWEVNENGDMIKMVATNNRKQAVIKGMQMGVIKKGQYKLMRNTNRSNWTREKGTKWIKYKGKTNQFFIRKNKSNVKSNVLLSKITSRALRRRSKRKR